MNRRLHLALLLVAFFGVVWLELPDAMAPLVLAIPYFALSVFWRAGVHTVDFASIIGLLGIGIAIGSFARPDSVRLWLWAKVVLAVSAALFVTTSRPVGHAAISFVPFAILAVWPAKKKKPNQAPEPTPMSVTPPAAQEPRQP